MSEPVASGVTLRVKADTRELEDALDKLTKTGGDSLMQAGLKDLGEIFLNSMRQRFAAEVDPEGRPWAPLQAAYLGTASDRDKNGLVTTRGVKHGSKILQASGGLFKSLVYQVGPGQLVLGSNEIYAAMRQWGGTILPRRGETLVFWLGGKLIHAKKVVTPGRAFVGLSASDRKEGLEALADVYEAGWSGAP